ncbi:HSP20-like chaperone [Syncephalis plumigaleata]|nr:HSP20-like chaperone [Syncephalis plumigaleata]
MAFRSIFPELSRAMHALENDVKQVQNRFWPNPSSRCALPASSSMFPIWHRAHGPLSSAAADSSWPAIDISEVNNSYVLEAELPGVAKDDVSVELDHSGEVVTLSGQVRQTRSFGRPPTTTATTSEGSNEAVAKEAKNNEGNNVVTKSTEDTSSAVTKDTSDGSKETYWAQERFYGSFRRAFQLPAAVSPDSVQASFRNGLLRVTMNKKEPQVPEQPSTYRVNIRDDDEGGEIKSKL